MEKEFSHHHRQRCLSRQANLLDLEVLDQAGQPNEVELEPPDQRRWSTELVAVTDLHGPEPSPGQQEQQQQCPRLKMDQVGLHGPREG